jgi:hypothetical protein
MFCMEEAYDGTGTNKSDARGSRHAWVGAKILAVERQRLLPSAE